MTPVIAYWTILNIFCFGRYDHTWTTVRDTERYKSKEQCEQAIKMMEEEGQIKKIGEYKGSECLPGIIFQ